MVVVKYDTNGNEQWTVYLNENGVLMTGPLNAMKFDQDGNLAIAGSSPLTSQSSYASVNTSGNGNVEWSLAIAASGTADIAVALTEAIMQYTVIIMVRNPTTSP